VPSVSSKRSLNVSRLGLALTILVSAGWVTATPYLLVRLGLPLPVELTRVDGPHAFLGLVAGGLIALKVVEVAAQSETTTPRKPHSFLSRPRRRG